MKVLMVSKACIVAAYRRKLEEMAALGVDLTLVVPPYWMQAGRKQLLEPGFAEGYRLIESPMALNGHFHLHFYPRLRDVIAEVQPDLVHLDEEPYDFVTFHGLRFARRANAAVVFFTWQNLRRTLPFPFTYFMGSAFKRAAGALAGNREAAAILHERGWRGPTEVIPQFGVDEEAFRPTDGPRPDRPFTIGYAGRLASEKGLPTLLDAVAHLEGDWRLALLGAGPERRELEDRAHDLGLSDRVQFLGTAPSTEMPAFYHRIDTLVLPSRTRPNWKEQFGRVLVEAMACGTPPVGSDSGEIPNVIGDAGLVFPEGDAPALTDRLRQLMHRSDERAALAQRGRARVLSHFTQRDIAQKTVAFYRRVLTESARR
ncbi:MAG: glycosyltransferase [Chloroflexi bacterium]|nr:glycosyltransferase [Chloroflexota bacterium]